MTKIRTTVILWIRVVKQNRSDLEFVSASCVVTYKFSKIQYAVEICATFTDNFCLFLILVGLIRSLLI